MMSQISSKCVYVKFSLSYVRHHFAIIEPPLETIPVVLSFVKGMYSFKTPA